MNCGNEMKMTQLHKLRSLRRSFLHFHFISAVHIWFISFIINTDFFYGNIWTHNWPALNVSGFIAQLVEHRTGKSRGHGFKPRWSPEFFSGFFTQLHKLCSLRRSFLHFYFISVVHIWFISYIINTTEKIIHHNSVYFTNKLNANEQNKNLAVPFMKSSLQK